MKKLTSLRDHLLSIPNELKIEADDLMVFADNGKIVSSADGTNRHFEYHYNANIIITNFSSNPDMLIIWLLQWLEANQPNHDDEPLNFDADLINNDSVDLSLTTPLTSTVKVESAAEGLKITHADDPNNNPVLLSSIDWTLSINGTEAENWVQNG